LSGGTVGVGADGAYKISNDSDLEYFFKHNKPRYGNTEYFAEKFVDGNIVTFDGLVDQNGNVTFCASLEYLHGIMEVVTGNTDCIYWITKDVAPDLYEVGVKVVKTFGLKNRFFHFEFFRDRTDNKLIGLESNLRLPGGYTIDMWNVGHEMDLFQDYSDMITKRGRYAGGVSPPCIIGGKCITLFVARRYRSHYAYSHEQVMQKWGHKMAFHLAMPPIFSGAMGDYAYIVRADTNEQKNEIMTYILQK